MREFGDAAMPVFIADVHGRCRAATLAALLPDSFSAQDLKALSR
jgi:cytidine deaminase